MYVDEFERELVILAYDMKNLLRESVAPVCQEYGLTLQQLHVLIMLQKRPGVTLSDLSVRAGILRTNFSAICRKLETHGFIERRRNDKDRRACELFVTQKGHELLGVIEQTVRKQHEQVFANEPPETFDTIVKGFHALESLIAKARA
ncbi:MarR family transcriptional regulator [bacterium D16-34]|nr:MarR family transcriptional regulator [bacterium D16-34]